jgi:hypothetical protein
MKYHVSTLAHALTMALPTAAGGQNVTPPPCPPISRSRRRTWRSFSVAPLARRTTYASR